MLYVICYQNIEALFLFNLTQNTRWIVYPKEINMKKYKRAGKRRPWKRQAWKHRPWKDLKISNPEILKKT
jgi:hypothetical protein